MQRTVLLSKTFQTRVPFSTFIPRFISVGMPKPTSQPTSQMHLGALQQIKAYRQFASSTNNDSKEECKKLVKDLKPSELDQIINDRVNERMVEFAIGQVIGVASALLILHLIFH